MYIENRQTKQIVYSVVIDEEGNDIFCVLPDHEGKHMTYILEYTEVAA